MTGASSMSRTLCLAFLLLVLPPLVAAADASARSGPAAELHALFADEWRVRVARDALVPRDIGGHQEGERLPVETPGKHRRRLQEDPALPGRPQSRGR